MNNLVIEGVSMYDYNPEKEGIDQGLSVQIAGLVTLDSTNKILPGQFVEISLPSTNPKSHDTLQKITGLPIDKKVLELKPVNPASFASRLLLHTNRILIDKRKYQQSMNIKLRSTNRWLALVHDIFNSYQFSMGWMMFMFLKKGFIKFDLTGGSTNDFQIKQLFFNQDSETQKDPEEIMVVLMELFGNINTFGTVNNISKETQSIWNMFLKDKLLKGVFFDTKNGADVEFDKNRHHRARNPQGDLQEGNPFGMVLNQQINHYKKMGSSLSSAYTAAVLERTLGKAATGSAGNGNVDIVIGQY